jgi:hypothetical protein
VVLVLALMLFPVLMNSGMHAQSAQPDQPSTDQPAQPSTPAPSSPAKPASRYRATKMPRRAENYYLMNWGVDSFNVKSVESGEMIRFSYRVVDAQKATAINDKRNEPSLVDEQAGVSLVVPTLEKVGQLRQSTTPEAGKVYWMVFSNKGGHVKRGDRVSVVIGKFRVEGLFVE